MVFYGLGLIFWLLAAFALYVRIAPTFAERWHGYPLPHRDPGQYPGEGRHVAILSIESKTVFHELDEIIRAERRTKVVAGLATDDMRTYVTRSLVFGFPDYTTVCLKETRDDDQLRLIIYGRLRFGRSDLGVNRKRINRWITLLKARGAAFDIP